VQPDFAAGGQEWLEEVITNAGHKIIFFPKFHCELNYIEMVWAKVKGTIRADCNNYSLDEMYAKLVELLQNIPLEYVRKVERRCFRFMHGYQLNMSGPLLDYAMKSFSSHRMFPSRQVVQDIEVAYKAHRAQAAVKMERNYRLEED
jgi:hypothetical protein